MNDYQLIVRALKNAKNNTEKIATFLLFGKRLSHLNFNDEEKDAIFALIDQQFLIESLRKYLDHNDEYEFAIYIVAYFIDQFVKKQNSSDNFKDLLKIFAEILIQIKSSNNEQQHQQTVQTTIVDCFDHIISSNSIPLNNDDNEFLFELLFKKLFIESKYSSSDINNVIANLVLHSTNADKFIEQLSQYFIDDKSMKKFDVGKLLTNIIIRSEHQRIIGKKFIKIIRDEIFSILQNRLTEKLRNIIIELCAELTMKFESLDWIKISEWNENNSKYFMFLLRLIAIEIEIILMNVEKIDEYTPEHYTKCVLILEYILFTLVKNVDIDEVPFDDQLKMNPSEIIKSIDTIQGIVNKIIYFLLHVFTEHIENESTKQMTITSLRFLCVYVKEENELFQNEINQLKPYVIEFINSKQNDHEVMKLHNLIKNIFEI